MHAGIQGQGNIYRNECIGPSIVSARGEKLSIYHGEGTYPVPKVMSKEDILHVTREFAKAARRARDAGFDGVELHGANGYLLDNFLTDYLNLRDDEYGGPLKNRLRLMLETINAVYAAVKDDLTVGIRISQSKVSDFSHKWAGGERDAQTIFSSLSQENVHYIHVTEYDATKAAFAESGPSLAALAKKYATVPIIANGGLNDPKKAQRMLVENQADLITIGKGALANHDWPRRATSGLTLRDFSYTILQPQAHIKEEEIEI